jgi:predicted small lipoprotein YifL
MGSLLGACGQKGPLYLPAKAGTAAKSVQHLPSAPEDSMPRAPLPPMQSTSSPGMPSGVVTNH